MLFFKRKPTKLELIMSSLNDLKVATDALTVNVQKVSNEVATLKQQAASGISVADQATLDASIAAIDAANTALSGL